MKFSAKELRTQYEACQTVAELDAVQTLVIEALAPKNLKKTIKAELTTLDDEITARIDELEAQEEQANKPENTPDNAPARGTAKRTVKPEVKPLELEVGRTIIVLEKKVKISWEVVYITVKNHAILVDVTANSPFAGEVIVIDIDENTAEKIVSVDGKYRAVIVTE